MKDFLTLPALELAGMLAAGELTSLELTQACLDRIHAVDRRVGAFLFVDDDGEYRSWFSSVPFCISWH